MVGYRGWKCHIAQNFRWIHIQLDYLNPLWVCIYYNQHHLAQKRISKINIYPGSEFPRPVLWVKWCYKLALSILSVHLAWLHSILKLLVNAWPSNKVSNYLFHLCDARMAFMQLFEDSLPASLRNKNSKSLQYNISVFHS